MNALGKAAKRLQNRTVIIFPEGTRTSDGKIAKFKAGAALLALSTGASLLPVTISGSYERMPKGSWSISPGEIIMKIDPPVNTTGKNRREIFKDLQGIRGTMIENLNQLKSLSS